ncbi:hypothetical protein [Lysobacter sp. GCM10012299]|uniref:hypothetical protein n=1 Tax=Lysobacter sp. GCM10012299 TaxID=3317333 RepID=UPI003614166A
MEYLSISNDPNEILHLTDAGTEILRAGDTREWRTYLDWLAAGNAPIRDDSPPPTLEAAKTTAVARLKLAVDAELAPILSDYPVAEVASWPVQLAEANAWLADPATPTPLLDTARGDTDKAEFCHSVVGKADLYSQAAGLVFAWRRACTDWILIAGDVEALTAWWPQYPEVPVSP